MDYTNVCHCEEPYFGDEAISYSYEEIASLRSQ